MQGSTYVREEFRKRHDQKRLGNNLRYSYILYTYSKHSGTTEFCTSHGLASMITLWHLSHTSSSTSFWNRQHRGHFSAFGG